MAQIKAAKKKKEEPKVRGVWERIREAAELVCDKRTGERAR